MDKELYKNSVKQYVSSIMLTHIEDPDFTKIAEKLEHTLYSATQEAFMEWVREINSKIEAELPHETQH